MIESGWKVKAKRRSRSKRRESHAREAARQPLEQRSGQAPASAPAQSTAEPSPIVEQPPSPATLPTGEQAGSQSARAWLMLAAGVLMSVGVMHTLVLQPLLGKVDALQSSVETLQADLASVSGVGVRVDQGTDLLSAMSRQQAELEAAGRAISEAERLTEQTAALSGRLDEAEAALARMRQLGEALTDDAARLSITSGFGPDAEEASGPEIITAQPAGFLPEPELIEEPEIESDTATDMGPVLRF